MTTRLDFKLTKLPDPNSAMSHENMVGWMKSVAARPCSPPIPCRKLDVDHWEFVRYYELGNSAGGLPIPAIEISAHVHSGFEPDDVTIGFVGSMRGNEVCSAASHRDRLKAAGRIAGGADPPHQVSGGQPGGSRHLGSGLVVKHPHCADLESGRVRSMIYP